MAKSWNCQEKQALASARLSKNDHCHHDGEDQHYHGQNVDVVGQPRLLRGSGRIEKSGDELRWNSRRGFWLKMQSIFAIHAQSASLTNWKAHGRPFLNAAHSLGQRGR